MISRITANKACNNFKLSHVGMDLHLVEKWFAVQTQQEQIVVIIL